jgi:hypothetical protein
MFPAEYTKLLAELPQLTKLIFSATKVQHGIQLHILTTGPPVHAKACRLDLTKLQVARKEFQHLEELVGLVRRSSSPWCPKKMDPGAHVAISDI